MPQELSSLHTSNIARAHRGNHQSPSTSAKLSKSKQGKDSSQGKTYTVKSKDRIRHQRGHDDRIGGCQLRSRYFIFGT